MLGHRTGAGDRQPLTKDPAKLLDDEEADLEGETIQLGSDTTLTNDENAAPEGPREGGLGKPQRKALGHNRISTDRPCTDVQDARPTLVLEKFSSPPMVEFTECKPGKQSTQEVLVQNPSKKKTIKLSIRKLPKSKTINFYAATDENVPVIDPENEDEEEDHPREWELQPQEKKSFYVSWCPSAPGKTREVIQLLLDDRFRTSVIMLGEAAESTQRRKPATSSSNVSELSLYLKYI